LRRFCLSGICIKSIKQAQVRSTGPIELAAVMTGSPLPSDRPATARAALWSFLFATGVLATTAAVVFALDRAIDLHLTGPAPTAPTTVELPPTDIEAAPAVTPTEFEQADAALPGGETYELTLNIAPGDTVERMLADIDVPEADRARVGQALAIQLGDRRLASGEPVRLVLQDVPARPGTLRVLSLVVRPLPQREFAVTRAPDGTYMGEERFYKLSSRYIRADATLAGSMLDSGTKAGAPAAAVSEFIKALGYLVDFERELRPGLKMSLLLEQMVTGDGKVSDQGRLMAGELILSDRIVSVVRFRPEHGVEQFYDLRGESVLRSFLRTPMSLADVTSTFGMREHPIMGYSAMHTGVDFAAPMGTAVLAAGAGTVTFADTKGGYGLFVKLDHSNQLGTGYAHLSRFGPGIRPGATVRQGQVIGFVGSTGTSTGPHLHYEFYRNGTPVNPLTEKSVGQTMLKGADLARFQAGLREYVHQFKTAPRMLEAVPVAQPAAPPPAPPPAIPATAAPAVPAAMPAASPAATPNPAPAAEAPPPAEKPVPKPAKRASKPDARSGVAASSQ
jgi:murein DD-endopeptidase MepM/ murein hydrolase activator NlpD